MAAVTPSRTTSPAPRVPSPGGPSGSGFVYPTDHLPFEQAAAIVLGELQHAVIDLLAAGPTEVQKAADVERVFGVNHLLGWQLYRIASAQNPLAAGIHVPARVSMKKLLTAAARRRVPGAILDRISIAFDAFERLVESDAGGREELDAMLNAFLPDERRKQDLAHRQSVFKGMSNIKGLAAEADVVAMLFNLSANGSMVDRVTLSCELGLRRLRPDAPIVLGTGDAQPLAKPLLTLDGKPADNPMGALLPQFSSSPLPRFNIIPSGGQIDYVVAGRDVGMRSAIDIVMAERREGALPRFRKPNSHLFGGPGYTTTTPIRRLTLDVFLHEDVFPGVAPQLFAYDTTCRGQVYPMDNPERQHDRLIVHDEIRALPSGLAGARLPHAPRYLEILEHIYATVGWDASRFRGYRLDVQYPVHGGEYFIGFRIPDEPAAR
jgi:hypothetical protein